MDDIINGRASKYLQPSLFKGLALLLVTLVPTALIVWYKTEELSKTVSTWISKIVQLSFGIENSVIQVRDLSDIHLWALQIDGYIPTPKQTLLVGVIAVVLIAAILFFVKDRGPIFFYLMLSLGSILISVIYFLLCGDSFPYTLTDYSQMYVGHQFFSWLGLFFVMALTLSIHHKTSLFEVILTYWLTVIYIVVFGCLRYLFYIVFLHYASQLFMFSLFFMFGIFWDFILLVSMYSKLTKRLTVQYKGSDLWKY